MTTVPWLESLELVLERVSSPRLLLSGSINLNGAERAAAARGKSFPKPHPLKKMSVASVKHCSILALYVLCSPLTGELLAYTTARRGAEERDVCHG